jgi:hypothetical protein
VNEILEHADELARRFENFDPQSDADREVPSLAALRRAVLQRSAAERELHEAVEQARADGQSWSAVGEILGTSGEAARQRFGHRKQA